MERKCRVKWIAICDLVLALLSIFYETLALTLSDRKPFQNDVEDSLHVGQTVNGDGDGDSDLTSENVYRADSSTRLLAYTMMKCMIYGLFFMQTYMAAKLFVAYKRIRFRALAALQKFSCWRVWSWIFLFLLIGILGISVVMNVGHFKWSHWPLYNLLLIQIVFRIVGIYYIGLCRKDVKDGLVHPAFLIDARQPPPPPPLHLENEDLRRYEIQSLT